MMIEGLEGVTAAWIRPNTSLQGGSKGIYEGEQGTGTAFLVEEAGQVARWRGYLCDERPVGGTSGVVAGEVRFRFLTGGAALGGRCLPGALPLRFLPLVSMTARIQ